MTRSEIYRELLRLDRELGTARSRIKEAQVRARMSGVKLPAHEYAAMWRRVYELESSVEATRLQLAVADETAAERFMAIVKAEHPAVFAQVSRRAGMGG